MLSNSEAVEETGATNGNALPQASHLNRSHADIVDHTTNVQETSSLSIPLAAPQTTIYSTQSGVHSFPRAAQRSAEDAIFIEAGKPCDTGRPPDAIQHHGLDPFSSLGGSHPAVENVCISGSDVRQTPLLPVNSHASSSAHLREASSTAALHPLSSSVSTEQKLTGHKQCTFTDGSGVLHSEYGEDPVDLSVRKSMTLIARKNTLFMAALMALVLVLTAAGCISVVFVNRHYTTQSHREYLQEQNRVVLNSSVLLLQSCQNEMQIGASNLMKFTRTALEKGNYQNVSALRDALQEPFFEAWKMWLFSSTMTAKHSIYVPFCPENEINSGNCSIMALSIACLPYRSSPMCTFEVSDDDGLRTSIYAIEFNNSIPEISYFKAYGRITVNYVQNQMSDDHGVFLDPSYAYAADDSEHPLLTMRRQESVTLRGGIKRVVMCDFSSFFEQWFRRYKASLQKSSDSYSMLFRNNGAIIAYGYGDSDFVDATAPMPCNFFTHVLRATRCGGPKAGVFDDMVDFFRDSLPRPDELNHDPLKSGAFTLTKQMGRYSVAYQDFLRFRSDHGKTNFVFLAAYATPIDSKLGRDGILQIVICVIIIFLCMFVLGGVALVAMTQMMRVVEVISQLATHAAMYDTKKMREVLDRQQPGCLARLITSSEIINDEFQRILANLNAYRPFLPQSLLTKGNFEFSDEFTERPRRRRKDDAVEYNLHDEASCDENAHPNDIQGNAYFPSVTDNALRHILSNPIENRRLLQRGFHRTKSTILVASLSNVAMNAADSVDVINKFVETVLEHAAHANGVVETIEYQKVVVSFNSHFPVPRHQEKACLCALAMRDSFQNSNCNVTIGISSGYNYVGTTGTEQQKARVIMGESVFVAHALTSLRNYLGCSIFANEAVVHESLVTAVVVDVVQLYYEHSHEWKQYNVSEIIGSSGVQLSMDMLLVKSVFKLVRYRQAEAALLAVRAYVKELQEQNHPLPWSVQRLLKLVEKQQQRIKDGYHRQQRHWELLEGEEVIFGHLAEMNQLFMKRMQQRMQQLKNANQLGSASVEGGSVFAPTDYRANISDGFYRLDETQIARVLMGEQSKTTAVRRLVLPAQDTAPSGEDTMFAIFVPNNDDDEAGTGANSEEERSTNQRSTPSTEVLREERDSAAKRDRVRPPTPPPQSSAPAVESRVLTVSPTAASGAIVSSTMPITAPLAGLPPPQSATGRAALPPLPAHHTTTHCNVADLPRPTVPLRSIDDIVHHTSSANSAAATSTSGRVTGLIAEGHLFPAASAWRGNADGTSGSSTLCLHNDFKLPQRIVSVQGQVFYRTSHQIGRGSFGAVYLVISETGYLGAMKTFPLNQSNAQQLIREVETLSQMSHENIVGYDCCAVQDDFFFIICEYMSAGTLGKLIQSLNTIPERAVRKYARDVLFGLCYLHQHSWVHCDIKPENILMLSDGTCKLADFGAALLSRSLTEATTMRGTARFAAPEAILGVCGKAGDVYSFGITLAQMVMGVHPWHAYPESDAFFAVRYLGEIRHAQETGEPCAMQPDLPSNLEDKELETVIHRCCEFDPKKRPTVEELLAMLS